MAHGRFFLYSTATALFALGVLLPPAAPRRPERLSSGAVIPASLAVAPTRHRPAALDSQMATMREIHLRLQAAPSPEARAIIVAGSSDVMGRGVVMMRQMRSALPTDALGRFVSESITEAQAEDVRDFLGLMSLLIEMKGDQESDRAAAPSHMREPASIGTKVRSTFGVLHVPRLA